MYVCNQWLRLSRLGSPVNDASVWVKLSSVERERVVWLDGTNT
jgi:hypothetical protein